MTLSIDELLTQSKVLPVITAHDVEGTVELARILLGAGMTSVEITLRSSSALECIREIKKAIPELKVAAGTVTNPSHLQQSIDAGADFYLSPGMTEGLLAAAKEAAVDFVPGVASSSDIMLGMDYGHSVFKLFPAVTLGGLAMLKSLAGPFPDVRFCPTGGLNRDNFVEFLQLDNVLCIGGSWMVSDHLVKNKQWDEIALLAKQSMKAEVKV